MTMRTRRTSYEELLQENERLRAGLQESEETLRAIRSGEVDALVVSTAAGEKVYTLTGAERSYRILIESMSEGAVMLDCAGTILYCNSSFATLVKIPPEKIVGKPIRRFVPDSDLPAFETLFRQGLQGSGRGELSVQAEDGTLLSVYLALSVVQVRDKANDVCMIVTDLTAQKRSEEIAAAEKLEFLEKHMYELARSNAELQQFAYVASHDLKEPLRAISSFTQLLASRYKGKLDPDADEFIRFIVDGTVRIHTLIDDLLAYSSVESKARAPAPTDFEKVLTLVLDNLAPSISENNAVLTHDPLPTVLADDVQMIQLFQNLISNAIKFRGPGPPRVHVSAQRSNQDWIFSVTDNGIGIDPEYRDHIFQMFRRLHGREEYPGTGIGLAICKKIAERHRGKIWVESVPGKGSTFYFTIPQHRTGETNGKSGTN